jgi:hypothetical protein
MHNIMRSTYNIGAAGFASILCDCSRVVPNQCSQWFIHAGHTPQPKVLAPALFDSGVLGFVGSEVAEMESMW